MSRHDSLAAQCVALLDPEPVLLVDDDEREVEEVDVLLEQGVRADHDSGVTTGDVEQGPAAHGRGLATRQQGHPGRVLGTTEHPPVGEVTEHRGDRAVVLPGEHLGGRQQRRLPPGIHRGQHRPQGDDGLARAHLTLEQTVHRHLAGHLVGDRRADLALPRGQLERQPGVEGLEDAPRPRRAGPGHLPGCRAAPLRQRHLEDERLLVPQPPPGLLDLLPRVRGVDAAQRLGA